MSLDIDLTELDEYSINVIRYFDIEFKILNSLDSDNYLFMQ